VDVLCEGACVMHRYNKQPIEIGLLQRFAMDRFYDSNPRLEAGAETGKRVACIGAGPASLACAAELRRRGIAVVIFDRNPMAGGLNTYGIAEYKLRPADSMKKWNWCDPWESSSGWESRSRTRGSWKRSSMRSSSESGWARRTG